MKSYSIQQKPCQFIAEGCSYQLQRYKNNLKKQMFLSENIEIAETISRVSRYLFPTKIAHFYNYSLNRSSASNYSVIFMLDK